MSDSLKITLVFSFLLFASISQADCTGSTESLGADCVHYQNTAGVSFAGLLTTRGSACEQAHVFLDNSLKTWAETNCLNKEWRPNIDASQRTCRYSNPMAFANRGVRCLRGLDLKVTNSFNYYSCQRSQSREYTAIRNRTTGLIEIHQNYGTEFHRQAEMLSPCEGDSRTAVRRCSYAVRDYAHVGNDCICTNGSCELIERTTPATASPQPAVDPVSPSGEVFQ